MNSPELSAFAAWIEGLMRDRGYDIDSPRGGGKSRVADEAGVHRTAVTRLFQRQSMPDLETARRLARVLGVPVRDMLIRSGRLTADELVETRSSPAFGPDATVAAPRPTLEEVADLLGVPADRREMFVRVVEQFLPTEGRDEGEGGGRPARASI
ncbi:helix-turn-helix transcriptional regulator [Streptomyces sp. ISL-12]|uniref:helix-turn-helix transcriptional regulator n=1 Tax=Streptomyces sp. ISL-12 TaxID=2819177 RepID=UPI001BEC3147|nr:helix-turn-helix transcriptional regulator [Streptomyces sp. ISL-12]MBT2409548.1 helix-turn-helix transcriptional regulator [Streptomyces sp. ISL-12]